MISCLPWKCHRHNPPPRVDRNRSTLQTRSRAVCIRKVTYSMEQSPSWEANRFAASQKFPCILGNPKVHCRIQNCQPPVLIQSQLDPVHNPTLYCLKTHFNIIPPIYAWVSPVVSYQASSPKPCIRLSSPTYAPNAPPISFLSILSPEKYLVRSRDHYAALGSFGSQK